ncbi:BCCT family transporter [Gallaecimonas sp. GXIMD4217]|uniref:BCCT family transporter n=1 Tax=Gallaecimonas sp. GXIMD4217 TaxID=3131927 RepID=UPI00311AF16E
MPRFPNAHPRFSKEKLSLALCLLAAVAMLIWPAELLALASGLSRFAITRFDLAFILVSSALLLLCLGLALSPLGRRRLGGEDALPEFGLASWLAMLFAAGMGSGLIFWGVAEPLYHYANPPAFAADAPSPKDTALALTYFHWGSHAWSIYAMAGLVMAWFAFNRGRVMNISASFTARRGASRYDLLDFMAVLAIVFGLAGTLANTIALVQTGLEQALDFAMGGVGFRLSLLVLIAAAFSLSSALGLGRGIKRLSQFNLAFVLLMLVLAVLWAGPLKVLARAAGSTLAYVQALPALSFSIDEASRQWSQGWSVIYLIWWIAWAPFVGPFIARISRGRTVRQFLLCTIFAPTLTSILWFSAFGGSALDAEALPQLVAAVNRDYTQGLFAFLELVPQGQLLALAAMALLITFVVTSADSAVYVTGMLTGNTGLRAKLAWSLILVAITAALVLKNDVDLNKEVAILGAIPFTLVLLAQVAMLLQSLGASRKAGQ